MNVLFKVKTKMHFQIKNYIITISKFLNEKKISTLANFANLIHCYNVHVHCTLRVRKGPTMLSKLANRVE